ncbi:MAG: hypothetical protein JSU96_02895 [Acidobacteriota bacterium]|nr:MAG: hypothetical protein JSU96_02895 [Acidobacteriota bacterium]
MNGNLNRAELLSLVERVFALRATDEMLIVMLDLPDNATPDSDAWKQRREIGANWVKEIAGQLGKVQVRLCLYRNVRTNNAELPERAWLLETPTLPAGIADLNPDESLSFDQIFARTSMILAPTEFSATAPLKLKAREFKFRAATMGGFSPAMIPALRLDYGEINRRVDHLKQLLDQAGAAEFVFETDGTDQHRLILDLRHRSAHASGGLLREPGTAGNLPSGETYIVPYEGEQEDDPSLSRGVLPVQFGDDLVLYTIEENRAVAAQGSGEAAQREEERLRREPAYGNIAELGLGVLDDFGIEPCGSILLDEKLGLHIAFGRSDHFGGQVGPADFSGPEAVVHIDRVYLPSLQPRVNVCSVDLIGIGEEPLPLMRDGRYVLAL